MDPTGFRALGLRYLPWSLCSPSFTGMLAGLAPRKNFPCPRALPPPPQSSRKHALFVRSASSSDVPISDCSERNDANSCNGSPAVDEATHHKLLQIVLVSPQIPGNTGAIARTCAASAVGLHLVEPLGYTIDDAKLKRAGLDYWPYVVVKVHRSWNEFLDYFQQQDGEKRLLAFTKRAANIHSVSSHH